jgi:diaminopimelate decarboxylase
LEQKEVVDNIRGFQNALTASFPKNLVGYSVKTNSLPYVMHLAKEQGCYAEVVSYHEYQLALKIGFSKDHIIYNGPMKSKETFLDALVHHAIVNIETWREIEWLKELPYDEEYEIGIRININISSISPADENHPADDSRFGFSYELGELSGALSRISKYSNIKVTGIHSHREPKTRSVFFYKNVIRYVQNIISEYKLQLKYWDLGGGFFGTMRGKPTYNEYVEAFYYAFAAEFRNLTIIVEPGNAVVASGFDYVVEVIDIKEHDGKIFVCTNGTRNDIDPFFHKSDYFKDFLYCQNTHKESMLPQVVCGLTCLEYDRLFTLPAGKKMLNVGDLIVFHRVGAYTMALTPLFIHYFPIVYVHQPDGQVEIVREEWTAEEYIQKSKF